jgi:hypothetical protein
MIKILKKLSVIMLLGSLVLGASGCPPTPCFPPVAPYGCKTSSEFKMQNGFYDGTINPRYYLTKTGIMLRSGDKVSVTLDGKACFASADPDYCSGPQGSAYTYGVYWTFLDENGNATQTERIGSGLENKIINFSEDKEYELNFMTPEKNSYDSCDMFYYNDNTGQYNAILKIDRNGVE